MSEQQNNKVISETAPELVTLDTLTKFTNQLLGSMGITLGGKSIIQENNEGVANVVNSAFFGEQHKTNKLNSPGNIGSYKHGIKNVLVSGLGNIPGDWNQTILGTFNKPVQNALFVLGNGTSDLTRNNILEVYNNGDFSLHGVTFNKAPSNIINLNRLKIDGVLSYATGGLLEDTTTWNGIKTYINNLDDSDLITADIAKALCERISNLADFSATDMANWRNNLVQGLDLDIQNDTKELENFNNFMKLYPGNLDDPENKALNVAAGRYLLYLINKNSDDAKVAELHYALNNLRRQVSYLISCLTVDKISNASYKQDSEELIECYAVGVADYAFDADTTFTFAKESPQVNSVEEDI